MKRDKSKAWEIVAPMLKGIGIVCLKAIGFVTWIVLSMASVLLKHALEKLKVAVFGRKDE